MMPAMTSLATTPTDPDPRHWLTKEKRSELLNQMSNARPLLQQGGLWRASLGYWVRWQASLEAQWPENEEEKCLNRLVQEWQEANKDNDSKAKRLSDEMLRTKLRVAPAIEQWSREQWSHRLDSIFLKSKHLLDQASCRILRVKEKELASELYYRIKAKETSFAQAARDFSEGKEKEMGGLIPLQPLRSMPFGLAPLLEQLEAGKISQPMRIGKGYCLVELLEFRPSRLDKAVEKLLLAEQLRLWIDSVVDVLEADLEWEEPIQYEVT